MCAAESRRVICWHFCDLQWQISHLGSRVALLLFANIVPMPKQLLQLLWKLVKVCVSDHEATESNCFFYTKTARKKLKKAQNHPGR